MTDEQRDKVLLSMKQQLDNHDEQFKSVNEELRKLSKSVAKLEVDYGSKIQALLDGQVGILQKLDSFEKRFESNEIDLEDHSNRIWNLESKVGIV